MPTVLKKYHQPTAAPVVATHIDATSARRSEAEEFIRNIFAFHYGARVSSFAPNLMLLEQQGRLIAATGWRSARSESLFLERYLDSPIEQAMAQLADQSVERERIVEVGNLAAEKSGGSLHVILALASHLDRLGYEWVVFTATQELVGIFSRLGLPLLALAKADPARLGDDAQAWGSYYATEPIIVAGRIRLAIERLGRQA
jgi:hypothetical protein